MIFSRRLNNRRLTYFYSLTLLLFLLVFLVNFIILFVLPQKQHSRRSNKSSAARGNATVLEQGEFKSTPFNELSQDQRKLSSNISQSGIPNYTINHANVSSLIISRGFFIKDRIQKTVGESDKIKETIEKVNGNGQQEHELSEIISILDKNLDASKLWGGIGEVGPASTPDIWQKSKPTFLLIAHPGWKGIFSAATAQGPVLGIPLSFSSAHATRLVSLISDTPSLKVVIIHGIPPGTFPFARLLKASRPKLKILFVYHGSTSAPFHAQESSLIEELLKLNQEKVVDSIGTVKVGFAEILNAYNAQNTFTVPNFPSVNFVLPISKYSRTDNKTHVGILASSDLFHKNFVTQMIAACSIHNVVVHVTANPYIRYLSNCSVVETGMLSHGRFLVEISRMDVLLYVTMAECYPMIILESMTQGIPVLVSRTHHILDRDESLSNLIVHENDNPYEISSKLILAISQKEFIGIRLRALSSILQREAETAWGKVLGFSTFESRNFVFDKRSYMQSGDSRAKLGFSRTLGKDRIAFLTYELDGVPGGAGVVISGIIKVLLDKGHDVIVLAYLDQDSLTKWTRSMQFWKDKLSVYHVPTLVKEEGLNLCGPRNVFLRRSWLFALAAEAAYKITPFDTLEVFDYVGIGFELLRSLQDPNKTSYIPSTVKVLIRLHGTLQLIHQSEGIFIEQDPFSKTPTSCSLTSSERDNWPLMYLMERYSLFAAHFILPQSLALRTVYSNAYGINVPRMIIAPPPVEQITQNLRNISTFTPRIEDELRILVYGRIMRVKGSETIAAAAEGIQSMLPSGVVLHLFFAGLDWECSVHSQMTSKCVTSLLPPNQRVSFLGPISRDLLLNLLPTMHGAIFASEFETFGLAAHELAATGVPIVISDIPAYNEFFNDRNSYVFTSGSPSSLVSAVIALHRDINSNMVKRGRISYSAPYEPYQKVFSSKRIEFREDLRLIEVAIARIEAECWDSC